MSNEIVIRVPQTPLPRALTEEPEYQSLSPEVRHAFLGHVRYIQELPFKLREWLDAGAIATELEALADRIDLDLMINLGAPKAPDGAISPWQVRSWVSHTRPLASFLERQHHARLNQAAPMIGATLDEVAAWVAYTADSLSGLLEAFFAAKTFDHAVAYLMAIYVCMAGLKFGLGRVSLQYPT